MPQATKKGKRALRVKKQIYCILQSNPDGLSTNQIYTYLQDGPAKRFINGATQIGQILKTMKGIHQDVTTEVGTLRKYKTALWTLRYPEEFLEWLGDDAEVFLDKIREAV